MDSNGRKIDLAALIKKKKERSKKVLDHTIKMLDQREILKEAAAKSAKPCPKNILR